MSRSIRFVLIFLAVLHASLRCPGARAADVYGVRFAPPRVYFTHASMNKSGVVSGLKGQENFLSLHMPPVDTIKGSYSPDGFSYAVLLPASLEVLDQAEKGLTVAPAELAGAAYQEITGRLDPVQVKRRCLDAAYGIDEVLWYRVKAGATLPPEPQEIRVTLRHQGKECFTDAARLRIYNALSAPPRVSPRHFRLYLHYGPHYRKGHWDELADALRRAGINAIQFTLAGPDQLEYVREMRRRGFYIIAQRGASYGDIYADNMRACLERGPQWFETADQGTMRTYLPYADAALWDFEPTPLPTGLDDWLIAGFRRERRLPESEVLTPESIRARYLRPWIDFRQRQLATCIKHWADFCRSVKPGVETILTEGGVLTYDPVCQIDYAKYQDPVTFCDPMNFTGIETLHVVRQWMKRAPRARFTGCQNVAQDAYHPVFITPQTIGMQVIGAALIGMHGTSIYPGPAMDAEDFVWLNRAMGFLGRHQKLVFEGRRDPASVSVAPLPKEEHEVALGNGRTLHDSFPDWQHDAIHRSYRSADGSRYLTVLTNWNAKEPCYFRLRASLPGGTWLVLDDERRRVFVADGKPQLPAAALARGIFVQCPPFDVVGVRLERASPATLRELRGYRRISLAQIAKAARAYSPAAARSGSTPARVPRPGAGQADPHLLLHLGFGGTADALVARGNGKATVTGSPAYEVTPGGRGIRIGKGVQLSYLPEGNIDLQRGRLYIRFKPAWEGADGQNHFLLRVSPRAGLLYFAKLDDGRLLCNLLDEKDGQHYPGHMIREVQAGTWHEAVVTWDAGRGTMALFFDGRKVSEYRSDPWRMGALDNRLEQCRLMIPEDAGAVIDDLKIWDRPW